MKCFAQSYTSSKWQGWNLNPGLADSKLTMTFELVLNEKLKFVSERRTRGPSLRPREIKTSRV